MTDPTPIPAVDYSDSDIQFPHYHPCGHCKRGSTGFACFDTGEPVKHAGIYELCQDCEEDLVENASDAYREQ